MDNSVRIWDPHTGQGKGPPLKGHSKWIRAIAWEPYHLQPSGEPRLASASKDGTVRIWSAITGRTEHVLGGHKGSVSCVRWGGTGRIYTSSVDKTVKIWDAAKGTLLTTLSAHAHWVNHLALSTDFALRTAFHDHTGSVPESETGRRAKARERFETAARIDSQIVERLVSASDDFTIYLWQPPATISNAKEKPLARLLGHQKTVNHVIFSPDGRLIASSAFDNHVKLWRASDGQFLSSLRAHVGPVYMSCFSADSRLLVSASKDTTLKVWDVRTGKMKEDLVGHKDQVFAVDWAPDGGRVGSGGADKTVRIWRH
jgi:WD40 repeat protein